MERIKVYLDTNTILDFFVNQAIAVKKGQEAKIQEKFKFFVKNLDKIVIDLSEVSIKIFRKRRNRNLLKGYYLTIQILKKMTLAWCESTKERKRKAPRRDAL